MSLFKSLIDNGKEGREKIDRIKERFDLLSDRELVEKAKSTTNFYERAAIKELARERGIIDD